MADKYKKLTIYVSEEQEKVLKDFDVMAIRKEQFPLLHYTVGLISKRLEETHNRMITDVDPITCDQSTLHYNSQTIE